MDDNTRAKKYYKMKKNVKIFRNSLNITFTALLILGGILFESIAFIMSAVAIGAISAYLLKQDYDEKTKEEVEYENRARALTNKMSGKNNKSKKK